MAKPKKNKRGNKRRAVFYESVPAAIATPPAALPEIKSHISETVAAVTDYSRGLTAYLRGLAAAASKIDWWRLLRLDAKRLQQIHAFARKATSFTRMQTGRATANMLWAARSTAEAANYGADRVQLAVAATVAGAQATGAYARPVADDLAAVVRGWANVVFGKRARKIYLSLLAAVAVVLTVVGTTTAVATISSYANDISSPAALLAKKKTGTTILDRNGQVLFEGYGGQATKVIPLDQIPKQLKDATLAAEDPGFYSHPGFSWRGTARAAWVDISHRGTYQGGSTLTQQLVKNALLTSDRNFQRKYQEMLLSIELERRYSKDQIFDMYLNEIYYGQGASGVEAAAQTYFNKEPNQLTMGESALLAGLPLGPSRFDPNRDLASATGRRDYVLGRMQALGKITKPQAEAAKAQPIVLVNSVASAQPASGAKPVIVHAKRVKIQAPHFVFYVLDQLRQQYGDEAVEQGGITVTTTLDLSKQQAGENAISKHVGELAGHHVTNGGLVSLAPATGDILAMVGSADYYAPDFGNVNVTLSDLQPGSSFKPIAYATAFEKGWNGATVVDDSPFSAPNGNGTMYTPQDYDGKWRGKVTLRRSLANSLNIPAIRVLQFAGIPATLQTAHSLGITTLNQPDRYGLSLVLGGGEVKPIDMATVYAAFANGGTRVEPRAILKVTNRTGKDITKPQAATPKAVLDPRIAYMVTSILSDNNARTEEFGPNSPLKLSRPVAAKTGTTNDFRDNWTVGYTPQIATAVWVGNNDHSPMQNVDGITGAAPIWHEYMEAAVKGLPVETFIPPTGVITARVCSDGGLANPTDTGGYDEVFMPGGQPTRRCSSFPSFFNWHKDKNNDHGDNNTDNTAPANTPDAGNPRTNPEAPAAPAPPIDTPNPVRPPRFNPPPVPAD